jgi:competence protein ComEA
MPDISSNHPALRRGAACVCLLVALVWAGPIATAAELQAIEGCTLVPTDWADGDSFRVKLPAGEELTVRLYGADCLEAQVGDETDARRLRSQRRYFGITRVEPDAAAAIDFAKNFGRQATAETRAFLARPFTLHTSFADARGDARFKRIYAFVFDADGRDLAAHLVSKGLARAFGVSRSTLAGESADDYRAMLTDLELRAAAGDAGIWAHTDWDSLPVERQLERDEERELQVALGNGELPAGFTVEINSAPRSELTRLPGIGETLANRIIEKRPYARLTDLLEVEGIGPATYRKLKPLLRLEPGAE